MEDRNYDVLLLRPHEITDVIDIGKAIDLVELASARRRTSRSSTHRGGGRIPIAM